MKEQRPIYLNDRRPSRPYTVVRTTVETFTVEARSPQEAYSEVYKKTSDMESSASRKEIRTRLRVRGAPNSSPASPHPPQKRPWWEFFKNERP